MKSIKQLEDDEENKLYSLIIDMRYEQFNWSEELSLPPHSSSYSDNIIDCSYQDILQRIELSDLPDYIVDKLLSYIEDASISLYDAYDKCIEYMNDILAEI